MEALDDEIERIEDAIAGLIAACEPMRERQELLESIPCVAAATSATVIAQLPELGQRSTSVLKALVGVAPFNSDSGGVRGARHIQGGRAPLRKALYMAAQSGYRWNPILKLFYERLRARGKSHKQSIVACVGKLVSIMNAIIKTAKPFNASTRNHKSLVRLIARPESYGRRGPQSDAFASVKGRNAPDGRELRPVVSKTRLRHDGRPETTAGVMLEACVPHDAMA